jgi:hypothetical protein
MELDRGRRTLAAGGKAGVQEAKQELIVGWMTIEEGYSRGAFLAGKRGRRAVARDKAARSRMTTVFYIAQFPRSTLLNL